MNLLTLGTEKVCLKLSRYAISGCLCIGLFTFEDGCFEPYGYLTVCLQGSVLPDNYGYVDVNNMPEAEDFIAAYHLGEFAGLMKRSGYCIYPLYAFDMDRLEELSFSEGCEGIGWF